MPLEVCVRSRVLLWNENSIAGLKDHSYNLSQKGHKSKKTILKKFRESQPYKACCDESVD